MKTDTIKDVTYYEGLPYTITVRKDDEGDFVARIPELPGCVAHGESESAAIENLRSVQRLWIEEALAGGSAIPEPEDDSGLPSGKWVQRVPRRLHRDLANAARRDKVSLNQLVTSLLAEALVVKSCNQAFQIFLSRIPEPTQLPDGVVISPWWPVESGYHAERWSTTSRVPTSDIMTRLSRVRNLKLSPVSDEPYAYEHTESHKQLARK
jgi:antitoxin HicB